MKILVTGQCTLHWGRLENGNIGNYYIAEATFRELHRVFPGATLRTTFQMTEAFCQRERVTVVPMEQFYGWRPDGQDLARAWQELGLATVFAETGTLLERTPYIETVLDADLVIDFSGELWGDHAEGAGPDRFLVGLLKMRTAQLLGCPTVLLASTEGPFGDPDVKAFAKVVLRHFALVANREPESKSLLAENGFDISKVESFACPAFLFESERQVAMRARFLDRGLDSKRPTVGFILCGFNFLEGPYDKPDRTDAEYSQFAESVEFIVNELGASVMLLSHQNGFDLPPHFKLINGRDYPIVKRLQEVVHRRGNTDPTRVACLEEPCNPWETKGLIANFDMLVTGRVHGFVAGVSSAVPSVLINRGFGPPCHRNVGFAQSIGMVEFIGDPLDSAQLKETIARCWQERESLRRTLIERLPGVQATARAAFDALPALLC